MLDQVRLLDLRPTTVTLVTVSTFSETWREIKADLKTQAAILFGFVAILWVVEIIDLAIFAGGLDSLGIHPRSGRGLLGILLAPFLHGGTGHLAANTGPLLILGWFVMWRETWHWWIVVALGALIGGAGTWLIGASNSVHIGASGVAFAFLGYLLLRGWFDRKFFSIIGSLIIGVLYGGLLFGVLPGQVGISWEGHLFGFVGGIVAARLLSQRGVKTTS